MLLEDIGILTENKRFNLPYPYAFYIDQYRWTSCIYYCDYHENNQTYSSNFPENCDPATSTDEISISDISIHPNPGQDEIYIESGRSLKSASIYNQLGQQVSSLSLSISTQKHVVKVISLKSWVYFEKVLGANCNLSTINFVKL